MTQKVGIYGIGISRHWQREPLLGFLGKAYFIAIAKLWLAPFI